MVDKPQKLGDKFQNSKNSNWFKICQDFYGQNLVNQ